MKNKKSFSWKKLFSNIFITFCRQFDSQEVTVAFSSSEEGRNYYKNEQILSSGMLLQTENFLRGNLLKNLLEKSPERVLSVIEDFYRISGNPVFFLIAADVCRYCFRKKNSKNIRFHLAAFRYGCLALIGKDGTRSVSGETAEHYFMLHEMQIVNEAVAGIFSSLKQDNLLDSSSFSLKGLFDCEFVFEKPVFSLAVPREAVSDFSLCSSYSVSSLRLHNRHPGIGVPLVAKVTSQKLSRSLQTPPGLTIPVTLFFRVKIHSSKKISLYPFYQDTSVSETLAADGNFLTKKDWRLATDFSTPLACFMNDITRRNLLSTMLNPISYDKNSGLFMVEPYRPDKIPVVFIHGLMSSPETWGQMINSLKYDSRIRERYQFWFFSYSTGVPVMYSSAKLNRALLEARREFCTTPEATEHFNQMVLIGHSMGGLITRVLLSQNPAQIVETLSSRSWSDIQKDLSPEEVKLVSDFLIFDPLPFVKRAVFMAVPHKGSAVAQQQIAKLGIRLIQLPKRLMEYKDAVEHIWKVLMPNETFVWRKNSFLTGIDNLNPKSHFVRWAGNAPLRQDVVFHSIMGNRKHSGVPGGSDGIVPYTSSHLNDVVSECIVKSNHSVHRSPEAIREVLRILLLHLRENEEKKG